MTCHSTNEVTYWAYEIRSSTNSPQQNTAKRYSFARVLYVLQLRKAASEENYEGHFYCDSPTPPIPHS